nr:hypothetical protein [uncultured Jannaschia sp.]
MAAALVLDHRRDRQGRIEDDEIGPLGIDGHVSLVAAIAEKRAVGHLAHHRPTRGKFGAQHTIKA